MGKIDVLDLLVILLETGVVECKIKVNLPTDFLDKLKEAGLDKVIEGPELAELIKAYRSG